MILPTALGLGEEAVVAARSSAMTSTPELRGMQLGELVLEPQRVEPVGGDARRS